VLRTLLRMGPTGWWELVEAQFWILLALWALRRQSRGELVHGSGHRAGGSSPPPEELADPRPHDFERAVALARAVDRVSERGLGRPLCLARSMALQHLLERRGVRGSRVRVGVRGGGGELEAHAWVEWGGHVLGQQPVDADSYLVMDDLVVGAAMPRLRQNGTRSGLEMTER
jgi:hypothetical protein